MAAEFTPLAVGLGEAKVSRSPGDVLVAYGLGSCLGVGMFDPVARVAGLLHAVLPERSDGVDLLSARFVDSGILGLLTQMESAGAKRGRLLIRLVGGANILGASGGKPYPHTASAFNIGGRNLAAAHATLSALNLPIAAQEVGGHIGRTVRLHVAGGRMTVQILGGQEREI